VRDFEVLGTDGHRMIEATSSWVVIDVTSRRMARPEDVLPSEDTACHDFAIEVPAGKVMMPRGVEQIFVTTHKVAYSDIDLVGHTNNARYVAWAMDCMDYGPEGVRVDEVEIVFHHEAIPGDEIALYRADSEGATFVEGRRDGTPIFCVKFGNISK
jgi:acyl-ACP thioesterase